MNSKKFFNNLIYTFLSNIVTIGLGLIVPRLILVGYGSEVNGLLSSVTQFIVYLNLFEAGIQVVAKQSLYKPVKLKDQDSINAILSAVHINYRKTGSFYLISLIILSLVYPFFIKESSLSYGTVFCVFLFSGLGNAIVFFYHGKYQVLLKSEGKNYILTNTTTIISVLNSLVKIVFLWLGMNVAVVIFTSFIVSLGQVIYIAAYIKRRYSWIDLTATPNHCALAQKNSGLIHQIAGMVFQNTDVLILTAVCGLKVVSIYSLYKMITSYLDSLLKMVFHSGDFALGQLFNTDRNAYEKLIDAVEVYYGGIVFAVYTVAYILFVPFIKLYTQGVTDIQYVDAYVALLFVVIGLMTHARMPMLNTINYAGHFKKTLPQTIIETMINLLVSIIAVNFYGIYGVLIGTIVALLYRTIDVILYANHRLLNRSAKKTFYIYAINLALYILLGIIIKRFVGDFSTYIEFIVWGFFLIVCVLAVYMVILSLFFTKEFSFVKSILSSKIRKNIKSK